MITSRSSNSPYFQAQRAFNVSPNDSTDLSVSPCAIFVGVQGNLAVTMFDGSEVTFNGVSGFLPILVRRVRATGTTATNIIALYN